MKRRILVVLLWFFTSGCMASQIIPKESVLPSIRTISVVPIECRPLLLHPNTKDDITAIDALMSSATSPEGVSAPTANGPGADISRSAAPLVLFPDKSVRTGASILAVIGGAAMLAEAASAGEEVPGEAAFIVMSQPSETWMPNIEYVKTAIAALRQSGTRDVRMIDGYVKLPITDRSITWHMENWLGPIRRLYSSDLSNVDYSAISSDHVDAILEVGVSNDEYYSERLLLQVFVRLIDPRTKQVLGRARNDSTSKTGPLAPLLQNDAKGLKQLILETGNALTAKCLVEIGLIAE